jgi:hypothetical protein
MRKFASNDRRGQLGAEIRSLIVVISNKVSVISPERHTASLANRTVHSDLSRVTESNTRTLEFSPRTIRRRRRRKLRKTLAAILLGLLLMAATAGLLLFAEYARSR